MNALIHIPFLLKYLFHKLNEHVTSCLIRRFMFNFLLVINIILTVVPTELLIIVAPMRFLTFLTKYSVSHNFAKQKKEKDWRV
jgi:quinol-cytochrome oxidoreductase complex cytochrome b subunit